ncbi:MAG: hypothetical protein K2X81_23150, partial [Candidatus Obscuribacterales bacterium]|nr:hypothetical protein [Candidatus Obscuribacterales bacterium]
YFGMTKNLSSIGAEGTSLAGKALSGFAAGAGISALSLGAGYALDSMSSKLLGYKTPEFANPGQAMIDGLAVPGILLSNMPTRFKIATAAGAFVVGRMANLVAGDSSLRTSELLRPSPFDGALMTGAALAPVDSKTKALLIGGAFLAGRAYNEFASLAGLSGVQPHVLQEQSKQNIELDQSNPSVSSFEKSVASAKTLGKENEVALELQMRDWMSEEKNKLPVQYLRGVAALADGLGQFRLEEGSRLDPASHANTKDRILKGFNLDFGGEATTWLNLSDKALSGALREVDAHSGQTVDGVQMNSAYKDQLQAIQKSVQAKLQIVEDPHDLDAAFKFLANLPNKDDLQMAILRMKSQADLAGPNADPLFTAKLDRDTALGMFAVADSMGGRGQDKEAEIMFKSASTYLAQSEKLRGKDLPDNQQLEKIRMQVAKSISSMVESALKQSLSQGKDN